jgi:V8-like Glu-specific endopeptidase
MTRTTHLALALALLTTACVEEDATTSPTPPEDQVTWREHSYTRLDAAPPVGDVSSLAGKSREELAELLRLVLVHPNGGTYLSAPNWEAADATLAPELRIDRVPTDEIDAVVRRAANPGGTPLPGLESDGVSENIIGGDGRALSPTSLHPFTAIARVQVFDSAGGTAHRIDCTGAFIGRWTFVLAAHCLAFPNPASPGSVTFANRVRVESARAGASLPFGVADCNNGDGIAANNFAFAVPAGYNGAIDSPLNFAVIDMFPCVSGGVPDTRKFAGYAVNTGTTSYSMHGYPLGRCPGAGVEGTFMCGMSDLGYVNEHRLESQLDGMPGQDGAPWFTSDPTRVAGVHLGYREYFDFGRCGFDNCRRQFARRIDNTMDTFIRNFAFDF